MTATKPPRNGQGRVKRPARSRTSQTSRAAFAEVAEPAASLAAATGLAAATPSGPDEVGVRPVEPASPPRPVDASARSPNAAEVPPNVEAITLSVLDLYRSAAEAQFAFWNALLTPSAPARPSRDDEAA